MLKNTVIMLAGLQSFVVTSSDGAPDNHYRIRDHHVEFRSVAQGGPPSESRAWRVLAEDELQLHFVLRTPVAQWLDKTLYAQEKNAA